jgi:hypothetical protein
MSLKLYSVNEGRFLILDGVENIFLLDTDDVYEILGDFDFLITG